MNREITEIIDKYLDKFIASDLILIKIKDEKYPENCLRQVFLERIKERNLQGVTSYIFLKELYLEKI